MWPGYLLVKMNLDEEAWAYVKDTTGVIDFLGGENPTPLTEKEVADIMQELEERKKGIVQKHKVDVGDKVKITDGVFVNFIGTVTEVNHEKGRLSVMVSIFGRDTRVDDLEFWQVSKLLQKMQVNIEPKAHDLGERGERDPSFELMKGKKWQKKSSKQIKLQIPAGKANPAPPIGPALGSAGINIMAFCKDFNAKTQDKAGDILPVIISVYPDKSFTLYYEAAARVTDDPEGARNRVGIQRCRTATKSAR